jgi:hypothetical protein
LLVIIMMAGGCAGVGLVVASLATMTTQTVWLSLALFPDDSS